MIKPLYELLKKGTKWHWGSAQVKAFKKLKELIVSDTVLTHYDPELPVNIACDASPYGIGVVISHIIKGEEHPIAFASHTLTTAEWNYAQIEREGLAVVWGIKKFNQFLEVCYL